MAVFTCFSGTLKIPLGQPALASFRCAIKHEKGALA
jgi:hypothetical protein